MLRSYEPISLPFVRMNTAATETDTGFDFEGAANHDFAVFPIPYKCEVDYVGILITEDCAGTSSEGEIRFDRRFTAGSDTGRGDADAGRIIIGDKTGASAQGDCVYDRAEAGATLEPGMEVVAQFVRGLTVWGKSGRGWPILVVRYCPEYRANMTKLTETT